MQTDIVIIIPKNYLKVDCAIYLYFKIAASLEDCKNILQLSAEKNIFESSCQVKLHCAVGTHEHLSLISATF